MDLQEKKINRVIQLLSKKECKQFTKFLQSPYFVKEEHEPSLSRLFTILTNKREVSRYNSIEEQAFFTKIYPEEIFIAGRIDKLFSQLNKLLYQFLGTQEIEKTAQIPLATAKVFRERHALDLWKGLVPKLKNSILQKNYGTQEWEFDSLMLNLEEFNFSNLHPRSTPAESYEKILSTLNEFYTLNTLYLSIQVLSHINSSYREKLKSKFKGLTFLLAQPSFEANSTNEILLIKVFQFLKEEKQICEIKTRTLLTYLEKVKSEVGHHIYTHTRSIIRNVAIQLYNGKKKELEAFILQLYQEDVENGAIFHEGKIQANIVHNISTFALRQRKFDWLDQFLEKFKSQILETDLQDFIISLNRSRLLFFSGKFEQVLNNLDFNVVDFHMKSVARILEVMTYYELDSDQLPYKIEAFKVFIFRIPKEKVSQRFILGHNTFVDILKSIIHPKTLHDINRIAKLRQKIMYTEVLAEKNWLLEKIDQLR